MIDELLETRDSVIETVREGMHEAAERLPTLSTTKPKPKRRRPSLLVIALAAVGLLTIVVIVRRLAQAGEEIAEPAPDVFGAAVIDEQEARGNKPYAVAPTG